MAHSSKGLGSFIVIAVLVYFAVRYWANIKAAVAPALAQIGITPAAPVTTPAVNASPGQPGDPAFSSVFGGSGDTILPGAVQGVIPPIGTPGFNVGPFQTDQSASGSPFVLVNTSRDFGSGCSTRLWDRKPLCS